MRKCDGISGLRHAVPARRWLRGRRGLLLTLLMAGGTLAATFRGAEAQPPRAGDSYSRPRAGDDSNRQRVVDDLVRELMETERLSRELQSDYRAGQPGNFEPTRHPHPGTPSRPGVTTREMEQARRILVDIAQEADRFTTLLQNEMSRTPEVRPLMTDALKLRARIAFLAQRAMQLDDHNLIVPDLKALDSDWRLLAYRLGQIRNLDRGLVDSMNRISQYSKTVGEAFKLSPQIDRSALIRLAATLAADLHSLTEDIDYEMSGSPRRTELLLESRRLEQQAQQMSYAIAERPDYNTVVDEYKRFENGWAALAGKLRTIDTRYLERSVRRIVETDNQIRELLWLPRQQDPQQYLYLTQMLRKDVDDFFTRAPLKLLIELPESQMVIPNASAFYGYCDHFIDCVNRKESYDELVDAFHYIESGWRTFNATFQPLQSTAARQVLAQIERDVIALREAMNIQSGYDNRAVIEMAAQLDNLGHHLDADMRRWLDRSRVPFRSEALRTSSQFAAAAHHLHESLVSGVPKKDLQRECDLLYADWQRVQQYVAQCDTPDRIHLQTLAARITPVVVELRTMLVPY